MKHPILCFIFSGALMIPCVGAAESPVNAQATDAVTQTNVKVLGEAPAEGMGTLYQTMAHSVNLAMENAAAAQSELQAQATVTEIRNATGAREIKK